MSYKEDLQIDRNALDLESARQPTLYAEYAEEKARAILERDRIKQRLDLSKAEIADDIRTNPERWGYDKKPAETTISEVVIRQDEVQTLISNLAEAQFQVDLMFGVLTAFDHRRSALESLVRLHLNNYYSEVKQPDSQGKPKADDGRQAEQRAGLAGNERNRGGSRRKKVSPAKS